MNHNGLAVTGDGLGGLFEHRVDVVVLSFTHGDENGGGDDRTESRGNPQTGVHSIEECGVDAGEPIEHDSGCCAFDGVGGKAGRCNSRKNLRDNELKVGKFPGLNICFRLPHT